MFDGGLQKQELMKNIEESEGCLPLPATVIQFSDGKIATETCFELDADNRHGCK